MRATLGWKMARFHPGRVPAVDADIDASAEPVMFLFGGGVRSSVPGPPTAASEAGQAS